MCKTLTLRHVDYGMKDLFVATQLSQRTLTLALFLLNYNLLSGLCLIPYYRYLGTTCYRNIIAVACPSCGASWELGGFVRRLRITLFRVTPCDGDGGRAMADGGQPQPTARTCSRGGGAAEPHHSKVHQQRAECKES